MSGIKCAEVTVRIRLPYSEDNDGAEYRFIEGRAKELQADGQFLASWYDFSYDPESGNDFRQDEGPSITVRVDP